MLVPIEWLRDYVAVPAEATGLEVAASLVKVGLEEEGLVGGDITGPLVVGRVLTQEPEPQKNGKTINWCTVDVGDANGTGEPQGVVCGAHNFGVGDLVVTVLPGAVLPGGFAISARKTYGHVSSGMICAADELGLPDDGSGGIIRLAERLGRDDLTPGEDAIPLLGLDRETIEVNVTPDRGYCFSLRGIAREYGHATGASFTDPAIALSKAAPPANEQGHAVRLADESPLRGVPGCDRYIARVVRGIDPQAQTPAWLATRITEAGMRPVSLAVDVTNYVMLALGQPLHAFDVSTLGGPIVVRRAQSGEQLTTLDGVERKLYAEDLLITDSGDQVLGIAGVMGGQTSEVSESTTDVLIEAAHFDPISVARSSRRHRLTSEASKRFERGVDPDVAAAAAQLAVDLLVEHGGGTVDEGVSDVDERAERQSLRMPVELPTRLVGVDYSSADVIGVLREIGCDVIELGDELQVTPPSWRPDLRNGPDLVEEVARLKGYDQIPSVLPTPPGGRGLTHSQKVRRIVANALAAQGLSEVLTYPFVSDAIFDQLAYQPGDPRRTAVRLVNPLSDEQPLMRTSVLSTLLDTVRRNASRGSKDLGLFELGLVVAGGQGTAESYPVGEYPGPDAVQAVRDAVPDQPRHLAFALAGEIERAGWWGAGRSADWSDAVATARAVGEVLAVPLSVEAGDEAPFHPGRCARLSLADGTLVGQVGELHPKVVQTLGLPARTVAGELDLDVLVRASEPLVQVTPLATYPVANSDVALTLDAGVPAAEVERALRSGAGELLDTVTLFDVYSGDQVGEGKKSLAYRLVFRSPERTLTTEEVNDLRDAAVSSAAGATGAVQRI
ncbi:phenylalanine--tRNA ligase subunit beta [Luteipulveratus mongoliensis]|uniref:Phenylalanine--tRNA ligase beta subunit n=1 Tax=Luteipulveratus mongoliensis TaxID=571913 RepID=A0A0K1JJA0_9MICO|nr:phenylalanine--tRNA ligase subunit beta [Luteipulveratus mongoliensis]AKU16673.1 phenylalanyl-tRNA synthetase subunit beta [Luteipulveratus mongoliensis]